MVKLMETKLLWTGPSLRVKVALEAVVEAEVALEVEVVAEEAEADLVAEAGEALEVRKLGGFLLYALDTGTCTQNVPRVPCINLLSLTDHFGEGRIPGSFAFII